MSPKYVCVLDMDLTLGFHSARKFHPRPKLKTLLQFLKLIQADIILWSHGKDAYVKDMVNAYLPDVAECTHTLFGRTECEYSKKFYNYLKASEHVRDMYRKRYSQNILLMGVDDNVTINMDDGYDLRIYVKPYETVNSCDKELMVVVEKMIQGIVERTQ